MKKNRFLLVAWLLLWIAVWLISEGSAAIAVIIATAVSAVLGVIQARAVCGSISCELAAEPSTKKGEPLKVSLKLKNDSIFGCTKTATTVICRNILTGQVQTMEIFCSIRGKESAESEFYIIPDCCGKIDIRQEKTVVYDSMGIYYCECHASASTASLSLPQTMAVELSVSEARQYDMSSDEYSMLKSGFDPSETFAIREYKEGDKIKNIHWKLSEKVDQIMVRELGLPVNNSILIFIENYVPEGAVMPGFEILDAMGEVSVSLSLALSHQGIPHQIAWFDRRGNCVAETEVETAEDLTGAMSGILSVETAADGVMASQRFFEERGLMEYAHVLCIVLHDAEPELPVSSDSVVRYIKVKEISANKDDVIFAEI